MSRIELEEMILSMAHIVVENRRLRQEVDRLREVEKEYHNHIMQEYKAGEERFREVLRIPLENICGIID